MTTTVCRGCDRPMVAKSEYRRNADLRTQFVEAGGYGMCSACKSHASRHGTLPDPAPRTKPVRTYPSRDKVRHCEDCGRRMATRTARMRLPARRRKDVAADAGRGKCERCYARARREAARRPERTVPT